MRKLFRIFRRHPLMAILAVTVLGIGMGSCVALYGLFGSLLSTSLPGVRTRPFISIGVTQPSGPLAGIRWSDYEKIRTEMGEGVVMAASSFPTDAEVRAGDFDGRLSVELVSSDYFQTLGVRLLAGRAIERLDEQSSSPRVAVIRSDYARRWFGQPAQALDHIIRIDDEPFRIVGIVEPPFSGALNSDISLWLPPTSFAPIFFRLSQIEKPNGPHAEQALGALDSQDLWKSADLYYAITRARDETDVPEKELMARMSKSIQRFPDMRLQLVPGIDNDPEHRSVLASWTKLAFTLAVSLFLVAVLNFSAFLVAQIPARLDEMRVRRNLGARSYHLATELMRGPLLLLLLSALVGAQIAVIVRGLVLKLPIFSLSGVSFSAPVPSYGIDAEVPINWPGFGMLLLLVLVGVALIGGLPTLELLRAEKISIGSRATSNKGTKRLLLSVIALQSTLALGSVLSASFLMKSLRDQENLSLGFDPAHVVAAKMGWNSADPPLLIKSASGDSPMAVSTNLALQRLASMSGVNAVAASATVPLSGNPEYVQITQADGTKAAVPYNAVTRDYFKTLGIKLLQGNSFSTDSFHGDPTEAVVNTKLAKTLWPDREALGRTIKASVANTSIYVQVVGVVEDARYNGSNHSATPMLYLPPSGIFFPDLPVFAIRGNIGPESAASALRDAFGDSVRGLSVTDSFRLETLYRQSFKDERLRATLGIVTGGILLLLAIIGVYGVTAFRVVVRRRELAIRICMGASNRSVVWIVLREMLSIVFVAIALTVFFWPGWEKVLTQYVNGTGLWNMGVWSFSLSVWFLAMIIAALIPSLKIGKLRPADLLRAE